MGSRFEQYMTGGGVFTMPEPWRGALRDVADTASLCKIWLEENSPGWSTTDLLVMTKMVMDRQLIHEQEPGNL